MLIRWQRFGYPLAPLRYVYDSHYPPSRSCSRSRSLYGATSQASRSGGDEKNEGKYPTLRSLRSQLPLAYGQICPKTEGKKIPAWVRQQNCPNAADLTYKQYFCSVWETRKQASRHANGREQCENSGGSHLLRPNLERHPRSKIRLPPAERKRRTRVSGRRPSCRFGTRTGPSQHCSSCEFLLFTFSYSME